MFASEEALKAHAKDLAEAAAQNDKRMAALTDATNHVVYFARLYENRIL